MVSVTRSSLQRCLPMRAVVLLLAVFVSLTTAQQAQPVDDDTTHHFSDGINGRAVWILEQRSLPWVGSFEYLSNLHSNQTVLLSVVDSSTGQVLGECTSESHGTKWVRFQWAVAADSMQCTVSPTNSSRILFSQSFNPRTFSIRLEAVRGPACIRDMIVQNEKPTGCPPHLVRNSFSSMHMACGCPYDGAASQGDRSAETETANEPMFPRFELGGGPQSNFAAGNAQVANPKPQATAGVPTWTLSPCANLNCQSNGTCVVAEDGQATCLCRTGYIGSQCEIDVCSTVPCQNGGICQANNGGEAVCQCSAGFTGILCESPACNPSCANGDCLVQNGEAKCECRQGFIGINCNIVDVCLGDAACAMFGDNAKCVLEASNYNLISPALKNASYDCRCPHPLNGEFMDCLELHLSSVAPSSLATAPPTIPTFGTQGMKSLPGQLPAAQQQVDENGEAATTPGVQLPSRQTFSIHPNLGQQGQFGQAGVQGQPGQSGTSFVPQQPMVATQNPSGSIPGHFPQFNFTFPPLPTQQPSVKQQPSFPPVNPNQPSQQVTSFPNPPSTFVFPQTPQTIVPQLMQTTETVNTSTDVTPMGHISSTQITETTEIEEDMDEEEEHVEEHLGVPTSVMPVHPLPPAQPTPEVQQPNVMTSPEFPTPSPMEPSTMGGFVPNQQEIEQFHHLITNQPAQPGQQNSGTPPNPFGGVEPTDMESTDAATTEIREQTTTPADYEEHHVEETEMPSTEQTWHSTTQEETVPSTQPTPPMIPKEVDPASQSSLPFWMFSTAAPPRVIPQEVPHHVIDQQPSEEIEGSEEEIPTTRQTLPPMNRPVVPVAPPTSTQKPIETVDERVDMGDSNQQKSSANAWVWATVIFLIVGIILLTLSVVAFRYLRQSRKLHGKYNPAREETNLSNAYSMPMSHITKEERLI